MATKNARVLAEQVLLTIARDHLEARRSNLDTLTQRLGVPRAEIRAAITALHGQGYVDALRMKLTLEGFALGMLLAEAERGDRPSIAA